MKKNKFSIFVGVAVLALTVGLNVRHALNDYGVKSNKLHVEVLAQATTTGGGSTDGGGSGTESCGWWDSKVYDCAWDACSILVFPFTYYGKYQKCLKGSSVAHCWDCAGCDAGPFSL